MTAETFLIFESAPGLLLVRIKEWDSISQDADAVVEASMDSSKFKQLVEYVGFYPFANAEEALETMLGVANGSVSPIMKKFLELHMPAETNKPSKSEKKQKVKCAIGVCDPALGKSLGDMGYNIVYNPNIVELHRGCRMHLKKVAKQLRELPISKFQVGLGHSYSRQLMQIDPRKQDKPIMQSIALIDSMDKNINSFAMKLKEWYGWHFPELVKVVGDTEVYCKILLIVKQKDVFLEAEDFDSLLEPLNGNESLRDEVVNAMKHSMGQDIADEDFVNIERFARQVLGLCEERKALQTYLSSIMEYVSPNLKAVVGEILGARLISHAGALVNLAKYPASTIQILGAEKALFRALKARSGRTPKYGLLFNSTFIGRVRDANHRGRMSRYLASKCALAARIDAFSDETLDGAEGKRSKIFGEKLREQLEERLVFLSEGVVPRKNLSVMREAVEEVKKEAKAQRKLAKKSKKSAMEEDIDDVVDEELSKKKKKKQQVADDMEDSVEKKKKRKRDIEV